MPSQFIGELLLRPILEFIFEILGYHIGRVVVLVFSLGRLKCDRFTAYSPRRKMRWGNTFHRRGQQVYLSVEATSAIGVCVLVLPLVVAMLIRYFRGS